MSKPNSDEDSQKSWITKIVEPVVNVSSSDTNMPVIMPPHGAAVFICNWLMAAHSSIRAVQNKNDDFCCLFHFEIQTENTFF